MPSDNAYDAGTDCVTDEFASHEPSRTHDCLESLRSIQQVQGHAVTHQRRHDLLPGLKLRQIVFSQGDDDPRCARGQVVLQAAPAINQETLLDRGGRTVFDEVR
jgi:hypothetical protein